MSNSPTPPGGPVGAHPDLPVCARHPDRATGLRCARCDRPACPDCLREASVGYQCVDCVRDGRRTVRAPRTIAGARRSGNVIVTPVLIAINVAVFALTAIQSGHPVPDATSSLYLDWLLVPSWFHAGEWWRLFSYGFLHASLPHLGLNMLALYILGRDLEPVFGRLRFTALYLVSQLGGGVAIYVFGEPNRPVVGASGAVYGLLGALLVAVLRLKLNPGYALGVIGLNLVLSVTVPGISLLGHVGGLVTGAAVAAGLIYVPGERRNLWQAFAVTGAVVVLIGLVLVHAAQFG